MSATQGALSLKNKNEVIYRLYSQSSQSPFIDTYEDKIQFVVEHYLRKDSNADRTKIINQLRKLATKERYFGNDPKRTAQQIFDLDKDIKMSTLNTSHIRMVIIFSINTFVFSINPKAISIAQFITDFRHRIGTQNEPDIKTVNDIVEELLNDHILFKNKTNEIFAVNEQLFDAEVLINYKSSRSIRKALDTLIGIGRHKLYRTKTTFLGKEEIFYVEVMPFKTTLFLHDAETDQIRATIFFANSAIWWDPVIIGDLSDKPKSIQFLKRDTEIMIKLYECAALHVYTDLVKQQQRKPSKPNNTKKAIQFGVDQFTMYILDNEDLRDFQNVINSVVYV